MTMLDIDRAYVSPYDKLLSTFDATHERSASQLQEIKKHQKIAELRDNPQVEKPEQVVWKEF